MPVTFEIRPREHRFECHATGVLCDADLRAGQVQLRAHPDFAADLDQLFDLTDVTDFQLSDDLLKGLTHRSILAPEATCAFVAPADYAFALARMFSSWNERRSGRKVLVFRTREEAMRWIDAERAQKQPPQSPPPTGETPG